MRSPRRALGRLARALGLRSRPLDWRRPPAGPSPPPLGRPRVDVIVPVHGGGEAVARCLSSVLRHTDLRRHRLVVVDDADPGFVVELPARSEGGIDWVVLHNAGRRGYPGSVNRGMRLAADRGPVPSDVVLLNSDTVVAAGWLEGLQSAALSAPNVGSVTPFSNHATICSLPRPLISNDLPRGFDVDRFAALVAAVAERSYPRLPTGVGMCLYLRRPALDRVGLFDEERFGLGYGEENDWSMRALEAGFVHLLADDVFVFHEGQRSFGRERAARVRAGERRLARLHPAYFPTLAAFLAEDPLRPARERVVVALAAARPRGPSRAAWPRRVLHLVHGWPPYDHGGTELYAAWLARAQAEHREVTVYARVADPSRSSGEVIERFEDGLRVRLLVQHFDQRDPLARNAVRWPLAERDFAATLAETDPELVHVHHLAGHGISLLPRAASACPVVLQVQDWWLRCARSNLWHREGRLCEGPTASRCARCLPLTAVPPAALWSRLLYLERRRRARAAFRRAAAWVMGSRFIERSYRDAGWLLDGDAVHLLPYGVERPEMPPRRAPAGRPLRFGFVGSAMPHKGLRVAVDAFAGLDPARATLEVWGEPTVAAAEVEALRARAGPAVRWQGPFAEGEKAAVFARLDVLLVPSLGLESYGLAAREAFAHRLPVIASRRGALGELFADPAAPRGGALLEPGDAGGLRRLIEGLADDPTRVDAWVAELPPVVSLDEHAAAIEAVYAEVATRRRRVTP